MVPVPSLHVWHRDGSGKEDRSSAAARPLFVGRWGRTEWMSDTSVQPPSQITRCKHPEKALELLLCPPEPQNSWLFSMHLKACFLLVTPMFCHSQEASPAEHVRSIYLGHLSSPLITDDRVWTPSVQLRLHRLVLMSKALPGLCAVP